MASREEVIKGLELCNNHQNRDCTECPYNDGTLFCADVLMQDALKLLKETEPILPRRLDAWPFTVEICGNCGEVLPSIGGNKVKFCLGCGRKVKWND